LTPSPKYVAPVIIPAVVIPVRDELNSDALLVAVINFAVNPPPTRTLFVTPIPSAVSIPVTVKFPLTVEGPTIIGPL